MLVTPIESIGDLDEAAYQLNDVLLISYHDSCIHKTSLCKRKVLRWNDPLTKLRKQVRKLCNHAKRTKSWDEYRSALTECNLELRRSKRATWMKCCENIADLPIAARIHKALVKDHANCVGLLKKSDGTYTSDRMDTLKTLLEVHFPGLPTDVQHIANGIDNRANSLSGKIFSPDKVKWADSSFKPFKAPGGDGLFPALLQRVIDLIMPRY